MKLLENIGTKVRNIFLTYNSMYNIFIKNEWNSNL